MNEGRRQDMLVNELRQISQSKLMNRNKVG